MSVDELRKRYINKYLQHKTLSIFLKIQLVFIDFLTLSIFKNAVN